MTDFLASIALRACAPEIGLRPSLPARHTGNPKEPLQRPIDELPPNTDDTPPRTAPPPARAPEPQELTASELPAAHEPTRPGRRRETPRSEPESSRLQHGRDDPAVFPNPHPIETIVRWAISAPPAVTPPTTRRTDEQTQPRAERDEVERPSPGSAERDQTIRPAPLQDQPRATPTKVVSPPEDATLLAHADQSAPMADEHEVTRSAWIDESAVLARPSGFQPSRSEPAARQPIVKSEPPLDARHPADQPSSRAHSAALIPAARQLPRSQRLEPPEADSALTANTAHQSAPGEILPLVATIWPPLERPRRRELSPLADAHPTIPETSVQVTIGRVEVRAHVPVERAAARRQPAGSVRSQSLEEYLRGSGPGRSP